MFRLSKIPRCLHLSTHFFILPSFLLISFFVTEEEGVKRKKKKKKYLSDESFSRSPFCLKASLFLRRRFFPRCSRCILVFRSKGEVSESIFSTHLESLLFLLFSFIVLCFCLSPRVSCTYTPPLQVLLYTQALISSLFLFVSFPFPSHHSSPCPFYFLFMNSDKESFFFGFSSLSPSSLFVSIVPSCAFSVSR